MLDAAARNLPSPSFLSGEGRQHEGRAVTVGEAQASATAIFREAGLETPALDARLLVAAGCGLTGEALIVSRNARLEDASRNRIGEFIRRRLSGEPVSRIVGRREFWGLSFDLSPHTLDPRPETELLVTAALDHVRANRLEAGRVDILDLGTGTGCLLAALLSELPAARGVGVDLSFGAILTAQENLRRLGLLRRAAFLCGEWASALRGASFDVVVCNPPYIASDEIGGLSPEVREFDPRSALDGGADGVAAYRLAIPQVIEVLKPGGYFVFETGYDQAGLVRDALARAQGQSTAESLRILHDLSGKQRAVAGVRQF